MRYFLGADVGSTKTHMAVADENGRVIAFVHSGPGNHQSVGYDGMLRTLRNGLQFTLFGGIYGFLFMLALYGVGFLFIRVSNRWRGKELKEIALGFGDVLLGGVIGLMVGWFTIVQSLVLTIVIAGAFSLIYISVMLLFKRYHFGMAIPYGPFVIIGAIYVLYF